VSAKPETTEGASNSDLLDVEWMADQSDLVHTLAFGEASQQPSQL
jgi:hypothetical protein